jgi:hypothetical protein
LRALGFRRIGGAQFFQRFLDGEFGCFCHGRPHIQATRVRTIPTRSKPGTSCQQIGPTGLGLSPPSAEAHCFRNPLLQILYRYPLI